MLSIPPLRFLGNFYLLFLLLLMMIYLQNSCNNFPSHIFLPAVALSSLLLHFVCANRVVSHKKVFTANQYQHVNIRP